MVFQRLKTATTPTPASIPRRLDQCDGIDNNCSGEADEGVTGDWFQDLDGDGFGNPDVVEEACSSPDGYVAFGSDCDDTEAEAYPGNPEVCDDIDNDCNDEVDEGLAQTWYVDADNDGYGVTGEVVEACAMPSGTSDVDGDCNDEDPAISPSATEICDSVDNDCDGQIDGEGAVGGGTWYTDSDGDGFGDPDSPVESCDGASGSVVADSSDCNDANDTIHPDADEVCDSVDNDCNDWIDDEDPGLMDGTEFYLDHDGDGFGNNDFTAIACEAPESYTADSSDCDDLDATAYPGGTEVCDDADNDCDGDIDEDATDGGTYYADTDGDGFGDSSSATGCDMPSGYVEDDADCNDSSDAIHPDADEVCDDIDNDCDGAIDDDDSSLTDGTTWYIDYDEDGYGSSDYTETACDAPTGYVDNDDDCDDALEEALPTGAEVCDEVDNDCDGDIDEGLDCTEEEEEDEEDEEETDWGDYSEEECDEVDTETLVVFSNDDADIFCGCGNVTVDNLYINSTSSDPVDLSCIEAVEGYLEIENTVSESIDLSNLTEIDDELYIHDNDDLESIDLSALKTVDSYLYINANNSLETFDLSSLEEVESYFYVQNHDNLEDIDLSSLTSIGERSTSTKTTSITISRRPSSKKSGSFQIYYHWSQGIETIYMPSLASIGGEFYAYYNYNIREVDLSSLREVGASSTSTKPMTSIFSNSGSLEEVGSNLYIYGSNNLETLDMDSLTDVNGSMTISYNTGLETLSAPLLENLSSSLNIQENTNSTPWTFPASSVSTITPSKAMT